MKLRWKLMGVIALFCVCAFAATALAADVGITVTTPSEGESTIAPGRSFYVLGTFSEGTQLNDGDKLLVELIDASGKTVRSISTTIKDNRNMYIDYPGLSYYGDNKEELLISGMPDLVWDGENEASFYEGDKKAYYNDTEFAALIPVSEGPLIDGMALVDSEGNTYPALPEGSYTIRVTVTDLTDPKGDDTDVFGTAEKQMEITVNPEKILTRFSPAAHNERITAFAEENDIHLYTDLFPGYWSTEDIFCEILPAWRAADGNEYAEGRAHFIIYNVKAGSATYALECAVLQRTQSVDDPNRLITYHYTYGEPTLPDEAGTRSEIVPFEDGDKLALVRAETTTAATEDNVYPLDEPTAERYDLDLADGVMTYPGETLSIYGVTAMIQLSPEDIIDNGDNSFTFANRINTIRYTLSGEGVEQTLEKEVKLNRIMGGWDNPSELEFKHDIPITDNMVGKDVQVSVTAYDAHGEAVPGATEQFTVMVEPASAPGSGGPARAATLVWFLCGACCLIARMVVDRRRREF